MYVVFNSTKVAQTGKNMQMHKHGSIPVFQGKQQYPSSMF
jgi:hypothetical protein